MNHHARIREEHRAPNTAPCRGPVTRRFVVLVMGLAWSAVVQADDLAAEAEASLSLVPTFEVLDSDNDGFINKDEIETQPAVARRFELMDANADQKLDTGEFARLETLIRPPATP